MTVFFVISSFLKLGVLGTSLLSTPFSFGKVKNKRINKGFKVDAGKDRFDKPISLFEGDRFYTKVATQDTDGDLYVYESTRQKNGGPALHFHYEQDEFWYVLKGEFMIKVGDEIYHAKEGDSVFGPRMVPHAFEKVGDGEAKLLMTFQPAGKMEDFFKAISKGVEKNISEAEKLQFRENHRIKVVGPALDYLKQ